MRKNIYSLILAMILLSLTPNIFCDEIIRSDGSKLTGVIVKDTDEYIIVDVSGMQIKISRQDIRAITKKSESVHPDEIQADFLMQNKKFESALSIYDDLTSKTENTADVERLKQKVSAAKKAIEDRELQKFATQLKDIDQKIQRNLFDQADKELDEILNSMDEKNPTREKILEKKAGLHYSKAKYNLNIVRNAEAEKELKTAITLSPKFAPAHIKYAEMLEKRGDIQTALKSYIVGVENGETLLTDKEKSDYRFKIGMIYFKMGEYGQAIKYFDYLIQNKKEYYSEAQERVVDSYTQLAALSLQTNTDKAIEYLKKALETNPKSKSVLFYLGKIYFDLNRFDEAIEYFTNLKNIDTKYKDLHYYLGMCFKNLGDDSKAKISFEQEFASNPDHFDSLCELGDYYFEGGDYDKAERHFDKAKEKYPEKFRGYLGLGKVFRMQRKNDKAMENLQKVLEYSPNHPEANLNLGAIYKDQEKYDQAKEFFQQVIDNVRATEKDRKLTRTEIKLYSEALIKKGEIDIILGQPRSAMDFFRDALKMQPNNSDAFYYLGEAFKKLKDFKSAEAHYKKAISMNSNEVKYYLSLGIIYQNDLKNLPLAIENYKNYILKGGPDFVNVNLWIQECGGTPVEPPTK